LVVFASGSKGTAVGNTPCVIIIQLVLLERKQKSSFHNGVFMCCFVSLSQVPVPNVVIWSKGACVHFLGNDKGEETFDVSIFPDHTAPSAIQQDAANHLFVITKHGVDGKNVGVQMTCFGVFICVPP
jgi:hypothetical protein